MRQPKPKNLQQLEYELDLLDQAEAIASSKKSLAAFIRLMWSIIEPATEYKNNWHIDATCEHLEAVTRGEIKNLIINMPPRHMKSIAVSVMWPAWVWVTRPQARFIFGSYSHTFALRDAGKMRDVVKSPRFQDYYKPDWGFLGDQDQKTKFENTHRGFRFTTSVAGAITGEGGDFLVADDPHNALEAESEVAREEVLKWWTQAMSTRGNDPKKTGRVIVMQRLHEKDLCGHVIKESGDYEELILPAEFERPSKITSLGWSDPRKTPGELLWPERFGPTEIRQLKKDLGSRGANSQLQQNPLPSEGGLFKRHWWGLYKERPLDIQFTAQFWDSSQKAGISNDFSVCSTWAKTPKGFYLLDRWRGKVEAPDLETQCLIQFNLHKPDVVVIEDKSSGSSLIQSMRRKHRHIPILPYNPGQRDKQVRASAATPTVESGNCFLPENAPWLEEFIAEHERFPLGENDDQVDTTSMMTDYFLRRENFQPRIRVL